MGFERHNAILATTWQAEAADALVAYANSIGAEAIRGEERTNGYVTVCITPDGSKEGWGTSDEGDQQRCWVIAWFAQHPDWFFEWVEVGYGNDDCRAWVVRNKWGDDYTPEPPPTNTGGGA